MGVRGKNIPNYGGDRTNATPCIVKHCKPPDEEQEHIPNGVASQRVTCIRKFLCISRVSENWNGTRTIRLFTKFFLFT